jgi:hypothetical protein
MNADRFRHDLPTTATASSANRRFAFIRVHLRLNALRLTVLSAIPP